MRFLAILSASIFFGQSTLPQPLAAQQVQYRLLEEIQSIPTSADGEWVIGGHRFSVRPDTQVGTNPPVKVGALAEVHFTVSLGKPVALSITPQIELASNFSDGPYVFWRDETTAEVVSLTNGKVRRRVYRDLKEPQQIEDVPGSIAKIMIDPRKPTIPKATWKTPTKLLAISDLEGNYDNALKFLQNNRVVDASGHWVWGNGQLVFVGDLVDRGDQVTELMWFIRRLEGEAARADGHVHYVLGNHETMVMSGDLRYIHPKYHFVSGRLKIPYDRLFDESSEIGRWWRTKNGVEKVGNLLFVHGGYSPLLDSARLDIDTLNRRIRDGLPPAQPTGLTVATNPVFHQHGPFWYRGYFDEFAAGWGGKATASEIRVILKRHQVDHIVVGHTVVDQVGPIDRTNTIIGIDVKWTDTAKGQGLLQEDGKLWRVSMNAKRERLTITSPKK
jgi:hypothetical protein